MSKTVLQQIKDEMNSLKGSANSWKRLVEFFENNKQIKPYYDEIVEECRQDNYFGHATIMILTIEKLLEEITDLNDELEYYEEKSKLEE